MSNRDAIRPRDLGNARMLQRPCCPVATDLRRELAEAGVALLPAPAFSRDEDVLAYLSASDSIAFMPDHLPMNAGLLARPFDGPERGYVLQATTVAGRPRGAALGLLLTQLRAAEWQFAAA